MNRVIVSLKNIGKILWIKNNEPENWNKINVFLPPNDYVIYKLTDQIVIDHTSAGNLGGIYDIKTHSWSYELMDRMGIPHSMMPKRILEPQEIAGYLTEEAANELGLMTDTPVCAGCIDCLASMLATGALNAGQHVAIIGTSINWGVIHNEIPSNIDYISMPYVKEHETMFYTYGGASTAGALPRWFRDLIVPYLDRNGVSEKTNYKLLDELAKDMKPGSDGLTMKTLSCILT